MSWVEQFSGRKGADIFKTTTICLCLSSLIDSVVVRVLLLPTDFLQVAKEAMSSASHCDVPTFSLLPFN